MSRSSDLGPVGSVVALALLFGVLGLVLGLAGATPIPSTPLSYPKPHQVPLIPGGTSLRLAMVHDVLHQRFPKHGDAWQEDLVRRTEARLAALEAQVADGAKPTLEALRDFDDQGAALDRLHRSDDAVRVLERKREILTRFYPEVDPSEATPFDLEALQGDGERPSDLKYAEPEQQRNYLRFERMALAAGRLTEHEQAWYRTHANLGTFLIHASFPGALAGEPRGRAGLERGAALIDKAIALNPAAHFGRERWQAKAVRWVLAALDDPQQLLRTSIVGLPLNPEDDPSFDHPEGLPMVMLRGQVGSIRDAAGAESLDPHRLWERWRVRQQIPHVFAWGEAVPYDEPTLAVLGMWMFGGGANPHFCLALGGLLERVGQRFIAWTAYARALELSERFWPDPTIREELKIHCLKRQQRIQQAVGASERELLDRFNAELAHGQAYQQAYADHEAEQLAEGADPSAPNFYDAFHAEHPPIASPVGKADLAFYIPDRHRGPTQVGPVAATALLFAGVGAWLGLLRAWGAQRKRRRGRG
jgi:tetratricopeptide (TPR) repeat protein